MHPSALVLVVALAGPAFAYPVAAPQQQIPGPILRDLRESKLYEREYFDDVRNLVAKGAYDDNLLAREVQEAREAREREVEREVERLAMRERPGERWAREAELDVRDYWGDVPVKA